MKLNKIIIAFVLVVGLFSCKKDVLMTYNSENSVYFEPSVRSTPLDTTAVSFAFAGGTAKDSTINIIVLVSGAPATVDRTYGLYIDKDSSTAKAGVHFEAPNATQSIKAGYVRDTIRLKLLRTQDMLDSNFTIVFKLKANENFNTAMSSKIISPTRTLNYIKYTVNVNDILVKPKRWLDTYLGTFTRKKLFMICDMLDTTPAYMDTSVGVGDIVFYGQFMQRYLNQMEKDGNTVYEDDGVTKMKMGPSVQ